MALQLGDEAPDFTAETSEGTVSFYEWLGDGWGVLFSHPKDFTPVCTTELGAVAKLKDEFAKRNAKVIAISVDSVESHKGWIPDINETQDTTVTVRSVFIVGPDKKVKLMITYPQSTGRNFAEILRVLDSLQLTAKYSVSTPADWQDGEDVIIAGTVTDEAAKDKFPKGWDAPRPYLRVTPQPNR